jgi:large conductance mechanosensitive channel
MAVFSGFKNFLMQGQLVVVAVGLSMALAFSVLVQTFTGSIITPQLLDFGSLVSAIVYFIVFVAVVYFAIVVPYRSYQRKRGVAVFTEPPPTKACPACLSDGLPLEATKCRYCATELTVEESGGLAEPA